MTQTPVLDDYYTPIFNSLAAARPEVLKDLYTPFDITPPSERVAPKFVPQIVGVTVVERSIVTPAETTKTWPNYNQQLAEVSAKAQEAVSGSAISVKDRRGIALVEAPHHFPTKAEKDAETAEFVIPPMPAQLPTIGVRPKLSLVKPIVAPTREERLGLDKKSAVKPLAEKIVADVEIAYGEADQKAVQAPVDFHKGVLALAEAALDRGAVTSFKEDDAPAVSKIEDGLGTQIHTVTDGFIEALMADTRSISRAASRMDHSILSGLHAAAERVRKIGMDNPPMHPQDAADYDATFGGKYMQEPVKYVGSDTVEMALPMQE